MKEKPLEESGCVVVCGGKSCKKAGAGKLRKALEAAAKDAGAKVMVLKSECLGRCGKGPVVAVWPEGVCFMEATPDDAAEILTAAGVAVKEKKVKGKKEKKARTDKTEKKGKVVKDEAKANKEVVKPKKEAKAKAKKEPKAKKAPKPKDGKEDKIAPPKGEAMTPEGQGYAE